MIFKKEKFDLDFEIFKEYGAGNLCAVKGYSFIIDYPRNKIVKNKLSIECGDFYRDKDDYKSLLNVLKELDRLIQLKNDIEKITPMEATDGKTE